MKKNGEELTGVLGNSFADGLVRVKDIIGTYEYLEKNFPCMSEESLASSDLLRFCVVCLHQTIEDLIRHLQTLRKVNEFLIPYETEINNSKQKIDGDNINNISELRKRIIALGLNTSSIPDDLTKIFDRRHKIVHHGDRNKDAAQTFGFNVKNFNAIYLSDINTMIYATELFYSNLLDQVNEKFDTRNAHV